MFDLFDGDRGDVEGDADQKSESLPEAALDGPAVGVSGASESYLCGEVDCYLAYQIEGGPPCMCGHAKG